MIPTFPRKDLILIFMPWMHDEHRMGPSHYHNYRGHSGGSSTARIDSQASHLRNLKRDHADRGANGRRPLMTTLRYLCTHDSWFVAVPDNALR